MLSFCITALQRGEAKKIRSKSNPSQVCGERVRERERESLRECLRARERESLSESLAEHRLSGTNLLPNCGQVALYLQCCS